jgi:hypothetical protein
MKGFPMYRLITSLLLAGLIAGLCTCSAGERLEHEIIDWSYGGGIDTPEEGHVMVSGVFEGSAGVVIRLKIEDLEEDGYSSHGDSTIWSGSRDSETESLPSPNSPPSGPGWATAFTAYDLSDDGLGYANPWDSGEVELPYDQTKDRYWVFVKIVLKPDDQADGPGVFYYGYEWNTLNPAEGRVYLFKLRDR